MNIREGLLKFFLPPALFCASFGCHSPISPPNTVKIDSTISTGASLLWKIKKIRPDGTAVLPLQGGDNVFTQPIRNGNKLYIIYDSIAQCLDILTGKAIWSASVGGSLGSAYFAHNMFLENGKLIFINEGKIVCLNSETGQLIWSLESPIGVPGGFKDTFYGNTAQSPEAIYVTSWYGGTLYKISKATGAILWQNWGALLKDQFYYTKIDSTSNWNGCPAYSNGRVYVPGRYGGSVQSSHGVQHDGSVACFDDQTGKLLWIKLIPAMDPKFSPYVTNSVATSDFWSNIGQGNITIFNDQLMVKTGNSITWMDRDGNILWRTGRPDQHGFGDGYYVTLFWQNKLFAYDDNGTTWRIDAIDPLTHNFLWTTPLSESDTRYHSYGICPPPAYVGNMIYFISDDNWVIGVDVNSGLRKYYFNLNNAVYDPTNQNQIILGNFLVDEEHHMYIMDNQYIYCFQMNQ